MTTMVVFLRRTVREEQPRIVDHPQGFASLSLDGFEQPCIAAYQASLDEPSEVDSAYVITATLRCVGIGLRPGADLLFIRSSPTVQSVTLFRQGARGEAVPGDALDAAVIPGWPEMGDDLAGWVVARHRLEASTTQPPAAAFPLNQALRTLGVRADDGLDEVTTLGLEGLVFGPE